MANYQHISHYNRYILTLCFFPILEYIEKFLFSENIRFPKDDAESPVGFRGVDVEGVTLGDSPTDETMMRGMPDYSASTSSLGSGTRQSAKQMTVTSPPAGWTGTSWTGGLSQGCAPAFKTSASVNDLPTGMLEFIFSRQSHLCTVLSG